MAKLPEIEGPDRRKPLSYDPATGHYITFDDIVHRQARVVPLDSLSPEDQTHLVLERLRVGPDYTMSDTSGRMLNREQIIEEIKKGTPLGLRVVRAEISYVRELLKQIQDAMRTK